MTNPSELADLAGPDDGGSPDLDRDCSNTNGGYDDGHGQRVQSVAEQRALVRRIIVAAAAVGLLLGFKACVAEPVRVRSDSMSPSIDDGAVVAVDKMSYRWRDPRRGEIVVAHSPDTDALIVKRVVAVEGDSVGIYDGQLEVNGDFIAEPYVNNDRMEGSFFGPVDVPDGHVFLLGDNRHDSSDSRLFGMVPVSSITGRLAFTVWPLR